MYVDQRRTNAALHPGYRYSLVALVGWLGAAFFFTPTVDATSLSTLSQIPALTFASTGNASPAPEARFTGINPASATPPDSHGAVSATHVVTHINGLAVVQDRNGNTLASMALTAFWASLGVTDVFDPRVIYDPHSDRFMAMACAQRRSSSSGMLFGVTATSDPMGNWYLWLLDADSTNFNWVDFPNIGVTADRVTLTGNLFSTSGDAFGGVNIWVLEKSTVLDGGAYNSQLLKVTNAGGTLVPALTYDPAETTQYLVRAGSSNLFGSGRLQVYSLTGSIGLLSFNTIPYASIGPAWSISLPNAKQLGSTATIETNDDRMMNAVIRNGRLWTVHTVAFATASRDHSAVKWWEITPSNGTVIQTGLIEDVAADGSFDNTTGNYYYYPSIAVNAAGEALIGFTGSGALEYASTCYAFRSPSYASGQFDAPYKYQSGLGVYSGPRWGDYSATVVDPVDDTAFWTVQQFAAGGNKVANSWAKVTPLPPDTTAPRATGATALTSTTVRISFSEEMQNNAALTSPSAYTFTGGLTATSVVRLNATQVRVTVNEMLNGRSYTATVSTGGPTDLAGNRVSGSGNTALFTGLGNAPTALISLDDPNPTNLNTVTFSVDFNESVGTSFTSADVFVTGSLSTSSSVAVGGGPIQFTVSITPSNANADGTIGMALGTGIMDLAGNTFGGDTSPQAYTLDNAAPVIGVTSQIVSDRTPSLSGTVNDNAASISVTVAGQTRTATNNANGTWTLADNSLGSIADGTYNVVATATDAVGNMGTDSTTNELTVNTTAPVLTVNTLVTRDTSPALSGTTTDPSATVLVVVAAQTRTATNNGNGTWTLANNSLTALAAGVYNVAVSSTDAAGNTGSDSSTNELTIDTTAPSVTINTLTTNDTTPSLTGTVNDQGATLSVTVGGQTRTVTNNADGTWTLANNSLAALAQGTYNVTVTANDTAGNAASDSTTNELIIDTVAPVIAVTTRLTNDTTPQLTGTVNDATATLSVTVGGQTRTATNNGTTWTLANNSLSALAQGTYNVVATATDAAGNVGSESTTSELTIDTTAPTITVTSLNTTDATPALAGTVNDNGATIRVAVGSQSNLVVTNNANGTWTLADNRLTALPDGTYNVIATARDLAGNARNDTTTNELVVDRTPPVVTVNNLLTNDAKPPLSGMINDTAATITVSVGGRTHAATNNGNGTWTLPSDALAALPDGPYDVAVTAADTAGNAGHDVTTNELQIDTTAPMVTVNTLTTNDATPPLGGTVDDATSSISVTVAGKTYPATNNGATWGVANNTITPALPAGVYNIAVTARDEAGNTGTNATAGELVVKTDAASLLSNVYVDGASGSDTSGLGTQGQPWATVAHAMAAVDGSASRTVSIHVAKGVYTEQNAPGGALRLDSHEHLLGGYEAANWTRNIQDNITVLDAGSASANAVILDGIVNAVMDGFTVSGLDSIGSTLPDSAAILCIYLDATSAIRNCTITNNSVDANGSGGIRIIDASPIIDHCTIAENTSFGSGGGVGILGHSEPVIGRCVIVGNEARYGGGGVFITEYVDALIANCVLSGNYAQFQSGAGIYLDGGYATVTNCTVTYNNTEMGEGAGIGAVSSAEMSVMNCVFVGNSPFAVSHPNLAASWYTLERCLFSANDAGDFYSQNAGSPMVLTGADAINSQLPGAAGNIDGDPLFAMAGGTWTAVSHDAAAGRTTLTDTVASFTPGALRGIPVLITLPDGDGLHIPILNNTASAIEIDSGYAPLVAAGDSYEIFNFHLKPGSPAIDTGLDASAPEDGEITTDLDGITRGFDGDGLGAATGDGSDYDIGAFESETTVVADTIVVISPNGGEVLSRGTYVNIRWHSTGNAGSNVKIAVRRGTFNAILASSTPNDGLFEWFVPASFPLSNSYYLEISSTETPTILDTSNAPFTLDAGPTVDGTVTVDAPNGGEFLLRGSTVPITWSSTGYIGEAVKIVLRRDSAVYNISVNTPNDGAFDWIVPALSVGAGYFVEISAAVAPTILDSSNAEFSLTNTQPPAASITVTAPNGGESYLPGGTVPVTWLSSGTTGNDVQILARSAGQTFIVTASTPNDGAFNWPVPLAQTPGADYLIEVRSLLDPAVADDSNAAFTIANSPPANSITILSPNGGETFVRGTTTEITWTSTGSVGVYVKIIARKGTTSAVISSSTPNDGSYLWKVPGSYPLGPGMYIEIRSIDTPSILDTCDGTFTLVP